MKELRVFENSDFGELGVLNIGGKSYFPATECAKLLGYSDPHDAVRRHTKGSVKHRVLTSGGEQQINFIPEGDLCRLITHSKLPSAERFERWVFDDVLPSIWRHGMYAVDELIENPDLAIAAFKRLKEERERRIALEREIEQDKPFTGFGKAIAANSDAILIGDFAKLICNSGINIGRTRLFRWLRDNGFLMKDSTMPYQRYIDQGLFAVKESSITTIRGDMIKTTTLVTGKGQMVLLDMLRRVYGTRLA